MKSYSSHAYQIFRCVFFSSTVGDRRLRSRELESIFIFFRRNVPRLGRKPIDDASICPEAPGRIAAGRNSWTGGETLMRFSHLCVGFEKKGEEGEKKIINVPSLWKMWMLQISQPPGEEYFIHRRFTAGERVCVCVCGLEFCIPIWQICR